MINSDRFVALLTEAFPEIAADIDECFRGLLHMEMGTVARATQAAISEEDTPLVKRHFDFIGEVYRAASPELKNAVHVSYLEHLSFEGRHGQRIKARELLSVQLQSALRALEAYNAELRSATKAK